MHAHIIIFILLMYMIVLKKSPQFPNYIKTDYNYEETMSTLKYANRAKSIENAVVRNEDMNDRMIKGKN